MKKTAIVVDTSASIGPMLEIFTLDTKLTRIPIIKLGSGFLGEKLYSLFEEFDQVYLFTDGYVDLPPNWAVILNNKLHIVIIGE